MLIRRGARSSTRSPELRLLSGSAHVAALGAVIACAEPTNQPKPLTVEPTHQTSEGGAVADISSFSATITTRVQFANRRPGALMPLATLSAMRVEARREAGEWNVTLTRLPATPGERVPSVASYQIRGDGGAPVLRDADGRVTTYDRDAFLSQLPRNLRPPSGQPRKAPTLGDQWYTTFVVTPAVASRERARLLDQYGEPTRRAPGSERLGRQLTPDTHVDEEVDREKGLSLSNRIVKGGAVQSVTTREYEELNGIGYVAKRTRIEFGPQGSREGYVVELTLTDVTISK